jgi:hypothetical protein
MLGYKKDQPSPTSFLRQKAYLFCYKTIFSYLVKEKIR